MQNLTLLLDFNDLSSAEWAFILVCGIATLALLIYLIVYLITWACKKNKAKELKKKSLAQYNVFILDFNRRKFRFLNMKISSKIKEDDLDSFISFIEPEERKLFQQWVDNLFENNYERDDKNMVFLTNFRVNAKDSKKAEYKKYMFVCKKAVKESRLLYLDLILLSNLPLNDLSVKTVTKKNENLISNYDNAKLFYRQNTFSNGWIAFIKLFRNEKEITNTSAYNKTILECFTVNKLLGKFKNGVTITFRQDTANDSCEIYALNSLPLNTYLINLYTDKVSESVKELLELTGFGEAYDFKVVAAKFSELPKNNFDESLKLLNDIERIIEDEEKSYTIYQKQSNELQAVDYSYKGAVDRVFKEKTIGIQYRSIIHLTAKRVSIYGYMTSLTVKDSYFKSYDDFKRLANKAKKGRDRLALESKIIINDFTAQKESANIKLLYEVELENLEDIKTILSHNQKVKNANLILTFFNNDFIDVADETCINLLKSLKDKDYDIGLKISLNDYTLKEGVYSLFDVFFFDFNGMKNFKPNTKEFINTHNLLERFLKYHKPLILINCPNWQAVELLVQMGISYFSSDVISQTSPMLLPLDNKITKKLLNLNKS